MMHNFQSHSKLQKLQITKNVLWIRGRVGKNRFVLIEKKELNILKQFVQL